MSPGGGIHADKKKKKSDRKGQLPPYCTSRLDPGTCHAGPSRTLDKKGPREVAWLPLSPYIRKNMEEFVV